MRRESSPICTFIFIICIGNLNAQRVCSTKTRVGDDATQLVWVATESMEGVMRWSASVTHDQDPWSPGHDRKSYFGKCFVMQTQKVGETYTSAT